VRVNGADRSTQFISATELRATLPASDFASSVPIQVVVFNPSPGGGLSNVATLTVTVRGNPAPMIANFSPAFLPVGSAATEVVITGSGFVPQSSVVVGFIAKPVTYVSESQLLITFTAAELSATAALSVRVINPAPGSGVSNTALFEVRAPLPVISSISETQTTAGQPGLVLRVNGSGFIDSSAVRFNGAPQPTRQISSGTLEATLGEGVLRAAGNFSITVTNPTPGGGTSNAVTFTLVNGVPVITLLPSQGATAGRSGFTLYVHGRGFVAGSVVRWNGSERATQYINGSRLSATINATDIAQPGIAQITVVNPGPGGGLSASANMTVRPLGAATVTSQEILLRGSDLAFEPGTARLYVSVVASDPTNANRVVAVDPLTATIVASTFVGGDPGKVALSSNGQFLYVGLNGVSAVRRVELPALTPGLQWSLPSGQVAGDLAVMPGQPNTVAVSRHSQGLEGVTIYDEGVARPISSPGIIGGNRIEFLETASVLYGFNNRSSAYEFFTIGIDATGARHVNATGGLISGFYSDIMGAAGRIYGIDCSVVDAEQRTKVGSFPGIFADALGVDPALGRAYVLREAVLSVYDLNNLQLLGSVTVPHNPQLGHPVTRNPKMVRWGTDGLAFLDQIRLFIVRSPIIGP
jgi:hypothetical protein